MHGAGSRRQPAGTKPSLNFVQVNKLANRGVVKGPKQTPYHVPRTRYLELVDCITPGTYIRGVPEQAGRPGGLVDALECYN